MKWLALIPLLIAVPVFAQGKIGKADTFDGTIAEMGDGLMENMAFRRVHDDVTEQRAGVRAYQKYWDLSDLPSYLPKSHPKGTVRVSGNYLVLGQVADLWKQAFAKLQPDIKLVTVAKGDLAKGEIDIQTGPRMTDRLGEISEFERQTGHSPLEIDWATGSFATPGWSPAFTIFVNKANPIDKLTLSQLDGIFGGARSGGWDGTTWRTDVARGSEANIRNWDQLGLPSHPIHVLGRPLRYNIQLGFERKVFHGGDVWNENLEEYAHELNPDGTRYTSSVEMVKDLSKDPYGICFADLGSLTPDVKMLALAAEDGGPYYQLTLDNLRERKYPLFLEQWAYVDQKPGQKLDPAVKEFLSFMLSREGQEAIQQDGKWLPIPAKVAREQLSKLDGVAPQPKTGVMGQQLPLISPEQGAGETVDEAHRTDPHKAYYSKTWDLSDLPAYQPDGKLSGVITLPAAGQLFEGSVGEAWIKGFRKYYPEVTFAKTAKQPDLEVGRKWTSYFNGEIYQFQLNHKRSPLELQVATGAYDVAGWSPALAIYVNRDNPITELSVRQLDGIFGGPRRGGWAGTAFRRQVGRGADRNIRDWSQVGAGEGAIHVFTRPSKYHLMGVAERKILQGGNMWNDSAREVPSQAEIAGEAILKAVAADRNAIAFAEKDQEIPGVKTIAISPYDGGAAAPLSLESVRDRSYPLGLEVYAYADHPLDRKLAEFLRFILSREGQDAVQRDGKWLPLTAELVRAQLKKLEEEGFK
jgi:ABC-type phosphate transport system substrate-binding protein